MTLDEAIIHAEEVAKNKKCDAEEARLQEQDKYADECIECAAEHRQLAEWLRELRDRRNKGKWIRKTFEDWWCNQCGNEICTETPENYHYCPNCGADMRKKE